MIRRVSGVALATVLAVAAANAADVQYAVDAGVGTTDNITRQPVNPEDETIGTVGLELQLRRDASKVDVEALIDLGYFDYLNDTYSSEVLGTAFANIHAELVPDRFAWILTDSFGQLSLDPFEAATPENRENVNFLTTGPDFMMRFGSQLRLTTFARYSTSQYEESDLGDQRLLGGLSLARELAAGSSVSFNVSAERVEFDDPAINGGYDRQSMFLRYDVDGARTRLGLTGGYTLIHDSSDTSNAPLVDIELARKITEHSTLTLRGGIRSTDAAFELFTNNTLFAEDTMLAGSTRGVCFTSTYGESATPDPFEARSATLCWQLAARRTSIVMRAGYEQEVYERSVQLDRERTVYQLVVDHEMTPRFSIGAEGWLSRTEFETTGQIDDESGYGTYLAWNAVGRLWIELDATYQERDSTSPLTVFDETRVFLRIIWRSRQDVADAE
jgi:Putative beta-barrel porin 2